MGTILPPNMNPPSSTPHAEKPGIAMLRSLGWGILLTIGLLLALAVSFLNAVLQYGCLPTDEHGWARVQGGTLGPFILACVVVGIYYTIRKARRTRRKVAAFVVLWTLIFALWTLIVTVVTPPRGISAKWPRTDKELGQLLARAYKEAAGIIPAEQHAKDEDAGMMRDAFRDVIQFTQQYQQEAAQFQTPEMANLFKAPSFRSRKTVEETIRQLQTMASVESKYSSLEPVLATFADRVEKRDWREGTKRGFLEGFRNAFQQQNQRRVAVYRVERAWIDASLDLYSFVLNNFSAFSVHRNTVVVSDHKTLATFRQKLSASTELHQKFLQASEEFDRQQKADVGKYGLTPSDLGNPQR